MDNAGEQPAPEAPQQPAAMQMPGNNSALAEGSSGGGPGAQAVLPSPESLGLPADTPPEIIAAGKLCSSRTARADLAAWCMRREGILGRGQNC